MRLNTTTWQNEETISTDEVQRHLFLLIEQLIKPGMPKTCVHLVSLHILNTMGQMGIVVPAALVASVADCSAGDEETLLLLKVYLSKLSA